MKQETLIYLADDDENIRSLIAMFLQNAGYAVQSFPTGDALYTAFLDACPDLVILDIMMPGSDGLSICNQIRQTSNVPLVLLTAKDSDVDQITGLTLGSDDYITKPFQPTLLVARVNALLRRVVFSAQREMPSQVIGFGDLLDQQAQRHIVCQSVPLSLTKLEYACLSYLLQHASEAVSRETLLQAVWGYEYAVETRAVDETIRRIRKKLAKENSTVRIVNQWGYGYLLDCDDET